MGDKFVCRGEGGGGPGIILVHVILLFESNKIFPEGSSQTPSISALAKAQAQRLIYNRIKKSLVGLIKSFDKNGDHL